MSYEPPFPLRNAYYTKQNTWYALFNIEMPFLYTFFDSFRYTFVIFSFNDNST
ncbi:hypothetical protein RhiirC2_802685 [Rhizophagus irregularis]|uniref:Uncharacterized protein n=1 Tax=Rhizophagus irregularis TaxID=588596 RepID=A0A2N1M112_9GLOM|nr:hypothetical protein RhiirC2_802685 [Rhizophagus irregularis]